MLSPYKILGDIMARTPWVFDSYSFPINPEEDTGWVGELVLSERVAINSTRSNIQIGGIKSDQRQVSGWIWGEDSNEMNSRLYSWMRNRTQATLVDHNGVSRRAILVEYKPTAVRDPKEWVQGRQTWRYSARFIALD